MKKRLLIVMLISALLMSPAIAFADAPDEATGNDIVAEQAVIEQDAPEAVTGETVDAAVQEDAVTALESDSEDPVMTAFDADPVEYDPNHTYQWNENRTMCFDVNAAAPVKGLFKAPMKDGIGALFYADDNGIVNKSEGIITVSGDTRVRFVMKEELGHKGFALVPESDKNAYTYLFVESPSNKGEFPAIELTGPRKSAAGTYLVLDNCTVNITPGIAEYKGIKYFILPEGNMQTAKGVVTDTDGSKYYVNDGGEVKTTAGRVVDGGTTYYVQNGGKIQTAAGLVRDPDGRIYYVQNGGKVQTTKGWVTFNGKKYYATTAAGAILTTPGVNTIDDKKYLVQDDWSVRFSKGIVKAGGKYYYVKNSKGTLASNKVVTVGKKKYHVKSNCQIWIGPHKWKKKYYFSTTKGYLQKKAAILKWKDHYYHSNKNGLITTGKEFKFKGKYYISSKKGKIKTGFFKWKGGYYLANKKGAIRTKQGKYVIDGYTYYITSKGRIPINRQFKGKDGTYRSDAKGHLVSGIYTWNNKYYYADSDFRLHKTEEILRINGKYYYNKRGGGLARSTFFDYKGNHYYAGSNAAILTSSFSYGGVSVHPTSTGIISDDEYYKIFPNKKPKTDDDDDNTNTNN